MKENKDIKVEMRSFDYEAYQAMMKNGDPKSIVKYKGKKMTLAQARRAQKWDGIILHIKTNASVCGPYILAIAALIGVLTWLFNWPYKIGIGVMLAVMIFCFTEIPHPLKLLLMLVVVIIAIVI